jgi:putative transcription factor
MLREPDTALVTEYNRLIKQAREQLTLSQEQLGQKISEKPSVIRLLETGRLRPDALLARKLEHALRIKLFVPLEAEE